MYEANSTPRTTSADRRSPRRTTLALTCVGGLVAAVGLVGVATAAPAAASTRTFTGIGVTANGAGYGLVASSGETYDYGTVVSRGNAVNATGGIVSTAVTADGKGYVEVSATGQVYAFGTVRYWANPTGFTGSITGISVTADGQGYVVVSSSGQNYAYGSVRSWGNPTGFTGSIVGVSTTADGQGYANLSSAGQVYAYGKVVYRGNGDPGDGPATPVGDVYADSQSIPCAAGTQDLGVSNGYHSGTLVRVRLCAVANLQSSSDESTPGSSYYVAGANRKAIVNSRVSGAVSNMVTAALAAGRTVTATSTFRTMAHQRSLCAADSHCSQGIYDLVAKPGTSNHQMGIAIDFSGISVRGGNDCAHRATQPSNALWVWLRDNASAYGFRQYSKEAWHWDVDTSANRC